ncbi:MAG: hypothetical protein SNH01_05725 [Rikenellaceae bacterium]
MKTQFSRFAAFLMLLAVSLSSCSESDEFDFVGEDNYITKLAITVDGATYNASIADDEVILTVPSNLSFTGATVEYTITEKATISPDPATKSDWDTEEMFVVTSYNDLRRSYTYRVVRSDIAATGNVILNTQTELEAFASAGNSTVNGNLTIGKTASADDPITSLALLSSLKTIAYDLIIGVGYTGTSLEGLDNLEVVGGISIDDAAELTTIYLPALTTIGTTLNILADNLESLSMDLLTSIGEDFTVKSNMLSSSSFDKLSSVDGTMTFNGGSSTTANSPMERVQFPSLVTVGGDLDLKYWSKAYVFEMPKLEQVDGCVTFLSWSSIEDIEMPLLSSAGGFVFQTISTEFEVSLPELTTLSDKLTLYAAGMTSFSSPKLESVGGILYIYATCTKLTTLDFSSLESVYTLNNYSAVITDFNVTFPSLKTVEYNLYLYNCALLAGEVDVTGITVGNQIYVYGTTFNNMTSIKCDDDHFDGKLIFYYPSVAVTTFPTIDFKSIRSLQISTGSSTSYFSGEVDLGSLETVTEDVTFTLCKYVTKLEGRNLKSVGSISFTGFYNITELNLPELETITGYDTTAGNFSFTATYATVLDKMDLTKLKSVDGGFTITSLTAGATMSNIGFENIETIGGALSITGSSNVNFTDLSTFSTLKSVKGVSITNMTNLTDFTGFSGLFPDYASSWSVSGCAYNPSYQNMVDGDYQPTYQ